MEIVIKTALADICIKGTQNENNTRVTFYYLFVAEIKKNQLKY